MKNIYKYNEFLLNSEINMLICDIINISEMRKISDNEYEWDIKERGSLSKLKEKLSKMSIDDIAIIYNKIIDKYYKLLSRSIIRKITITFLSFISLGVLIDKCLVNGLDNSISKDIIELVNDENKESSFDVAQSFVKEIEAGYSSDVHDNGNYITQNGKRLFIGTNHGISANLLLKWYKTNNIKSEITKEDMIELSYETALEIFKSNFWDKLNLSKIKNQNISNIIYDGCVNQGIGGMRSILRASLSELDITISDSDNIFSTDNIDKLNTLDPIHLFNTIKKNRKIRYEKSKTYNIHGKGWISRLDKIVYI